MQEMVRVRFAPSPTGIPHVGNTRTALFNFLFAKANKGEFILRIEDTDRTRFVETAEKAIEEILLWLGLAWDEKFVQSERLEAYKEHAEILKNKNLVDEDEGALRFKMPKDGSISWKDGVGNKDISFENSEQEDFVIIKSDGYPTYNFANVIDDHLMQITHVIRGEEFISSTPKHIALYAAFGWEKPVFVHLPVILGQDKTKLSKRHGAKSVLELRDEGYLPDAINNFMALLGWNPGGDKEIMSMDEMTQLFKLNDINTANPVFDVRKLLWMNGEYIRKSQISNLKFQISNLMGDKLKNIDEKTLDKLIELAKTRMKTLLDFGELAMPFVSVKEIKFDGKEKEIAKKLKNKLSEVKNWGKDSILSVLKEIIQGENIKMSVIYKVITGKTSGLPLPESLEILGKEKTLKLISK